MWYAASEIVFFLIVAAAIGALIGYGVAQIYQLDFAGLRSALARRRNQTEALAEARVEVADLRRKLDLMTEALREDRNAGHQPHPVPAAVSDDPETAFPAPPVAGHFDVQATEPDTSEGRRLSERVADAERG